MHLPQSLIELAELDFRVGRWVPALAGAYEAIALFEETAQRTELGFAQATIARMEAALGPGRRVPPPRAGGLRRRRRSPGSCSRACWPAPRSDCSSSAAAIPTPRSWRSSPWSESSSEGKLGEPWLVQWAPDLIEACSHVGRTDRAVEVLETFERQAQATGRISAQAAAARCRGLLAPDDAFEEHVRGRARAARAACRRRSSAAGRELAYGERLRRTQKRTKARERLRAALQTFERLGAEPWAERARSELRASGQSVRTPEQQVEDALTPQELQVAALVAGGATNREAAAALFLSVKTIEFHLGHVYRKLGIRSRTELARVVESTV